MPFQELSPEVLKLLTKYNAPPSLRAHLTIVHDLASSLITQLDAYWPLLDYDRQNVLLGAATHDIGKVMYTEELTGPGAQHEEIGPQILRENGFPEKQARFARTHAQWQQEKAVQLEDVLVAFADTIWKGERNILLERKIAQMIAKQCQEETWETYMKLDDVASELVKGAHERILWQGGNL